jgi:hypothetical protein
METLCLSDVTNMSGEAGTDAGGFTIGLHVTATVTGEC